jgi:predicted metal-binding membrane protein
VTAPAAAAPAVAERPALQLTRQHLTVLGLAALAWAGVIAYARHMGNGPGTMGLAFGTFVAMWSLMMTAMMLPAVAPVGSLYIRAMAASANRGRRLAVFVLGYLVVWAAAGIPAYLGLRLVDDHVATSATTMRVVAAVVLAAAGVYQLTPLKAICLRHCRSPLGQLLRYGNAKGRTRDLKVSVHHAGFCLGCCWALMALFVAFGVMNIWAMLGLAALVVGEKLWRYGEVIARVAGATFLALALAVAVSPRVAGAVVPSTSSTMSPTSGM